MTCEEYISTNGTIECCPTGYTGKTDVLSFAGYGCPVSINMEIALHSVALLGTMVLVVKHFIAIKCQYGSFKRARTRLAQIGKTLFWYQHPPLLLLAISFVFGITSMFVASFCKVVHVIPHQVGIDIPVSIAFIFQGPTGFLCTAIHELRSFELVSRGSGMKRSEVERLIQFLQVRYFSAIFLYGMLTCVALVYAIVLGKVNPERSPMRYLLVVRNLSLVVYISCMIYINREVVIQATSVLSQMSKMTGSAETARAAKVIQFLTDASKQKKKFATVIGSLYIIFSIPPLWPFQTIASASTIILASFNKAHPVNNYLPQRKERGSTIFPESNKSTRSGFSSTSSKA